MLKRSLDTYNESGECFISSESSSQAACKFLFTVVLKKFKFTFYFSENKKGYLSHSLNISYTDYDTQIYETFDYKASLID